MKHIVDDPLTAYTTEEFEHIIKMKLEELVTNKVITGTEPVERYTVHGVSCFHVRILYGTHNYLDLVVDDRRRVKMSEGSAFSLTDSDRWAGRAFAKYVEECVSSQWQHAKFDREASKMLTNDMVALLGIRD